MSANALARDPTAMPQVTVAQHETDTALEQRALEYGLSPVAARVLANRQLEPGVNLEHFLNTPLSALESPDSLADIDASAHRLAAAVIAGETVAIQTDYDTDGLGAHATFLHALQHVFDHPSERLHSIVGNRLTEGYGLTQPVADRILALEPRPAVLVTADNGSSDEDGIAQLADVGIDVLVTDHHLIPNDEPPPSAYACINPQRKDCGYADKSVAGGMVTWLLLAATRRVLIESGHLEEDATASLGPLLDYVACSTVADCVSLASINNRAVINHGLKLIASRHRPCWHGMERFFDESGVTAQTIAFQIAPRIHSRTRLADPMAALEFLMAPSREIAEDWALRLDQYNQERKQIESDILDQALAGARTAVEHGYLAVTLFLEKAHPGVQGICSSCIVERYGRPTLLCSPTVNDPNILTGSARAIDRFHFRDALQRVADSKPGLLERYGGHRAAAGVTLRREHFEAFQACLEKAVREQISDDDVGPRLVTDGELCASELTLRTVDELKALEPFGRGFESPTFEGDFQVIDCKPIGDKTHLRITLLAGGVSVPAVWFRARRTPEDVLPCQTGDTGRFVYVLDDNVFRRRRTLQLKIVAKVS
jgi:single-stranded-DNA-specific exonuclease